jgi:hypothetical protein
LRGDVCRLTPVALTRASGTGTLRRLVVVVLVLILVALVGLLRLLVRGSLPVIACHPAEVVRTFAPEDLRRTSTRSRGRWNIDREHEDNQHGRQESQMMHSAPFFPTIDRLPGRTSPLCGRKDVIFPPLLSRVVEEAFPWLAFAATSWHRSSAAIGRPPHVLWTVRGRAQSSHCHS